MGLLVNRPCLDRTHQMPPSLAALRPIRTRDCLARRVVRVALAEARSGEAQQEQGCLGSQQLRLTASLAVEWRPNNKTQVCSGNQPQPARARQRSVGHNRSSEDRPGHSVGPHRAHLALLRWICLRGQPCRTLRVRSCRTRQWHRTYSAEELRIRLGQRHRVLSGLHRPALGDQHMQHNLQIQRTLCTRQWTNWLRRKENNLKLRRSHWGEFLHGHLPESLYSE